MGFNYDRYKKNQSSEHQWTSYSDLFMALSVIFLLLYVVASVRQGTSTLQQFLAKEQVSQEVDDLRRQLRVYNALNQDYLDHQAAQDEVQMYEELMDQLHLLQDQARQEKEELRRQASENERKEMALNEYQQMVRNMINAQLLSRTRIQRRDEIIDHKESQISEMERNIREKQEIITQGEREIIEIRNQMAEKVTKLEEAYRNQEISKQQMEEQITQMQTQTQEQISQLEAQNQKISEELTVANLQLDQASTQLDSAQSLIEEQQQAQALLRGQLTEAAQAHQREMQKMRSELTEQQERERQQFEEQLQREKLSAAERAKREAEFAEQARQQKRDMEEQLKGMQDQMQEAQERLRQAEENAKAREELAKRLQEALDQAGVKASVDGLTGDVVIDFGDYYFETGRADLKPGMKDVLEKAIPSYSQTLLGNPEFAERISAVEIMGFASPTYQGRYVDPNSLSLEDREAVNYNLDLSYQRARSMFNYIFDTKSLQFDYQDRLLPLVQVTGRSYLAEAKSGRSVSSEMTAAEFCEIYDCKQAQTVIIRFNLKE